jgi:hypothetical protein
MVLQKGKVVSDILKWDVHPGFTRVSGQFKNTTGAQIDAGYILGQPVKLSAGYWVPVLATDEANVEGLLIYQDLIEDLANAGVLPGKVNVLVKGPAIINTDNVPAADVAGDALNWATIAANLDNMTFVTNPDTTETQTT